MLAFTNGYPDPERSPALRPPAPGYTRQWMRCRRCGMVQFYDFVPYSLSNPIRTTLCGHGATERDLGCDSITAEEAARILENTK